MLRNVVLSSKDIKAIISALEFSRRDDLNGCDFSSHNEIELDEVYRCEKQINRSYDRLIAKVKAGTIIRKSTANSKVIS